MLTKMLIAVGLMKAPEPTMKAIAVTQAVRYGKFGIPVLLGVLAWRHRDKLKRSPKTQRVVTSPYCPETTAQECTRTTLPRLCPCSTYR